MNKRKASEASLLPTRAPKQPRVETRTFIAVVGIKVAAAAKTFVSYPFTFVYRMTCKCHLHAMLVDSSSVSLAATPTAVDSPPQSSWRPPSPVSDDAEEDIGKITSRPPPPPVSKVPDVLSNDHPYPTPESTPLPETPPPQAAAQLANEPTEVIDLTESTPEPSPQSTSQRRLRFGPPPAEPSSRPKSFANSTATWRSIQEIQKEREATGSHSGSTTSEASSYSSFNTLNTSKTSLSSNPSSSLSIAE
jgi:hypothetical protein